VKKAIQRIISYAAQIANPDKIILFGSMSNGTQDVYSDLDLLIISDNAVLKKQITEQIKHFAEEFAISADVLVYSNAAVEREIKETNSFLAGVMKSGKIVYQKDANLF
jgi:predicted nucleotidyltransferase